MGFLSGKTEFKPKETGFPFLKLEAGEEAIVKVLSMKKSTYDGKEQKTLLCLNEEMEKIQISDKVLIRMWEEDNIQPNEVLRITCEGWKKSAAGKYRLLIVETAGIDTDESEDELPY